MNENLFDEINIKDSKSILDEVVYNNLNNKFNKILNKLDKSLMRFLNQNDFDELTRIHKITGITKKFSRSDLYNFLGSHETDVEFKDLNWIDVSDITDFSYLFYENTNIEHLDISEWNMDKAIMTDHMFMDSNFNGNISNWNLKNCINANFMFYNSWFDQDLSHWNLKYIKKNSSIFNKCPIKCYNMPQNFKN